VRVAKIRGRFYTVEVTLDAERRWYQPRYWGKPLIQKITCACCPEQTRIGPFLFGWEDS
jgi:hypothetical protein